MNYLLLNEIETDLGCFPPHSFLSQVALKPWLFFSSATLVVTLMVRYKTTKTQFFKQKELKR